MKKTFTTALLLSCFMICLAVVADLNGKWVGKMSMDNGHEYPLAYNFKVDGNKLTGTALAPGGDVPIEDGKITGADFSFTVNANGMDIPHTGKFYGDSTTVDLDISGEKVHAVLKRADK